MLSNNSSYEESLPAKSHKIITGIRLPNSWITAYTWGLQFVLRFYFCGATLMVLWDEIGLCRKTIFKLEKLLSPRMLGLLPIRAKSICLWKTDYKKPRNDILTNPRPFRCPQNAPPGIERPTFTAEVPHSDHYATGTLPSRHFAFSLSLFALAAKGWGLPGLQLRKSFFSGAIFFSALLLWNSEKPGFAKNIKKQFFRVYIFFPHCSHETQTSPALQKTSKNNVSFYFSHASCQICQLHRVTSFKLAPNCADACNTYLRML